MQNPASGTILDWGRHGFPVPLGSNGSAASIFQVEAVTSFYVGPEEYDLEKHFQAWIPNASRTYSAWKERTAEGRYPIPQRVWDICPFEERDKYLVPQMVIRYIDDHDSPLTWDFANFIMNLA
jgi:hypothetical protein